MHAACVGCVTLRKTRTIQNKALALSLACRSACRNSCTTGEINTRNGRAPSSAARQSIVGIFFFRKLSTNSF